ncbi:MAG TPA: DUF559 domain-containing protein [Ignavibacteria bacterium]
MSVELDGSRHYHELVIPHDGQRTNYLNSHDIKVLRFYNSYVFDRIGNKFLP